MNHPAAAAEPHHDFDFLHGRWQVSHRRLRHRLAACTDWDRFGGTCEARPLLDGRGNVDDNTIDLPESLGGRYRAATLRAFDPAERQWSIWWLDGRWPGRIDVPMRGAFDAEGKGLFLADDSFEGRPIRVRFLWLRTRSASPRWEQAFSADQGTSWETNWEMDFTPLP
jgi:hypothetical protein